MAPGTSIVIQSSVPEDGRIIDGCEMDLVMDLSDRGSVDGYQGDRIDVDGVDTVADGQTTKGYA